jgi:hypothetical protein
MIPRTFFVKNLDRTREKMVNRLLLEELRMLMDWQLRELGYDPQSINEACRKADGE